MCVCECVCVCVRVCVCVCVHVCVCVRDQRFRFTSFMEDFLCSVASLSLHPPPPAACVCQQGTWQSHSMVLQVVKSASQHLNLVSRQLSTAHSHGETHTCTAYTTVSLTPSPLLLPTVFPPASGVAPLHSDLTDTSVTISFRPLVGVVTVYAVEYHLEKDTWDTAERLEVMPTANENGVISTSITGLEPNSPYEFRFFSRNDLGDSAQSSHRYTGSLMCDTQMHTHTWTLAMPTYISPVASRPGADKWAAVQRHCSSFSRVSCCTGTHKVALHTLWVDFLFVFFPSCSVSHDT